MVASSPTDDVARVALEDASGGFAPATKRRLEAIDLVRGVVMVVMVLDHMRAFVDNGFGNDPTNLETTTPALFMTRWVTHFCAPVFVFLAGTAAYLQLARKSRRELSRFLVTRGLWLILLEITLVRLGAFWSFDPALFAVLQVIWALGVSMIVLAALIHLPLVAVGALGIAMIALHNLLDPIQVRPGPDLSFDGELWLILHQRGPIWLFGPEGPMTFVLYPLIPWIGVMAAGFAFGRIYAPGVDPVARRRLLVRLGLGALLAFVVLRVSNLYGDPSPWADQGDLVFTLLSLLDVTKYPPSLSFLLVTLGPTLVVLGLLDGRSWRAGIGRILVVFGRVPLFFYLLQWPLAHAAGVLLALATGAPTESFSATPPDPGFGQRPAFGLVAVYLGWLVAIALLYLPCRWFAALKARRRSWWLSYL